LKFSVGVDFVSTHVMVLFECCKWWWYITITYTQFFFFLFPFSWRI